MIDKDKEIVMYLIVRNDLGMSPGKIAAQCGHGVELALAQGKRHFPQWTPDNPPCAKIVLQANYDDIALVAFALGLMACIVIDEGRTEVPPNTLTVMSTVPAPKSEISRYFKHLKLLK